MNEREWAVLVISPCAALRIEPAGNRRQAERRIEHYRRAGAATGRLVYRYTFMPQMPWVDLDGREVHI